MLEAKNVVKSFNDLSVLKGISLEIKKGELATIVGASGSGKSTLLHILGTLEKPNSGEVYLDGTLVTQLKDRALSAFRNSKIGFVFQSHHLLPEFNALENVCLPAYIAGKKQVEAEKLAKDLLELLGLENRMQHKPNELSGGEQQRIAVARALINKPLIVFADEPSGNLDQKNADELHQLFVRLKHEFNQTFVIVTHNPALAGLADKNFTLHQGQWTSVL